MALIRDHNSVFLKEGWELNFIHILSLEIEFINFLGMHYLLVICHCHVISFHLAQHI